jgi:hypothetical protein
MVRIFRNAYNILDGKREMKKPLWGPRSRRENSIKMDLKDRVCGLRLTKSGRFQWRALVNTVVNLWVP